MRLLAGVGLAVLLSGGAAHAEGQFKVYFNRQIPHLTESADDVVAAAVQQAIASNAAQIDLVGHTDTAEKGAKALSLARAKAVKAALLRHKLPRSVKITIKGVGATRPDFPTPPNTSEPLNREVTVTIN
jgi:outer membrane protein OmpA-like peptidoglycan-associated protein